MFRKKEQALKKAEREPYPDKPKLTFGWDDKDAKNVYVLYQPKVLFSMYVFDWYWSESARGDKAWATKTANHYGVPLPAPTKPAEDK